MALTRNPVLQATLLIAFSACCFGSLTILTLLAMQTGLSLVSVIFWRFLLAALVLGVLTGHVRSTWRVDRTGWRLVAIGGIGQAIISYLSFKSLDYLPVGALAFLFYTYPAWVAIISALRGREALTRPRVIALAMTMSGIVVMVGMRSTESLNPIGIVMALGTAFLYAIYLPLIHDAQEELPALLSSFYIISGITVTFLVAGLTTGQLAIPDSRRVWLYLVLLAIVGTVLAFGSLMAGLRILGPVRTSIVATIEPFFTAILGAAILRQPLTVVVIGGGLMIATAVVILEQSSERAEDLVV